MELNKMYEINYIIINNRIQKDMTRWSTLILHFSSRIEVVKMNLMLSLLYLLLSLPVRIQQRTDILIYLGKSKAKGKI